MAMANCLKILLLWAGIIVMAEVTTAQQNVSTTLPPRTRTNSSSAFSLPNSTSTPRTMTETAVISPDNQTTSPKPPLSTPTLTSNPPMPSTYSTSISATAAPPAITSPSLKPTTTLDLPKNTSQAQPQPPITTSNTSVTTNAKVPGEIKNLVWNLLEHNVIHATCDSPNDFNGPRKGYIARLYSGGDDVLIKTLNQTECKFEFKDLSYSTKYKLQVTAFNGQNEGKTKGEAVTTSYDDKALIVRLVFFIMASVAFAVVLYKIYTLRLRKSRNDAEVDENAVIELTEIYANVSQSE